MNRKNLSERPPPARLAHPEPWSRPARAAATGAGNAQAFKGWAAALQPGAAGAGWERHRWARCTSCAFAWFFLFNAIQHLFNAYSTLLHEDPDLSTRLQGQSYQALALCLVNFQRVHDGAHNPHSSLPASLTLQPARPVRLHPRQDTSSICKKHYCADVTEKRVVRVVKARFI